MDNTINANALYQNILDFQSENEEMVELYERYNETEVYNSLVRFYDNHRPDWRKRKGLGGWAPEFMLRQLELVEDEEIQLDLFFLNYSHIKIKQLSEILLENYELSHYRYQINRINRECNEFELFWNENFDDLSDIFDEELYNQEYKKFNELKDEEIYLMF